MIVYNFGYNIINNPNTNNNNLNIMAKCTTKQWVEKAINVHGKRYNYDKSIYTKSANKIIITCPDCGDFEQIAGNHINQGSGCPNCRVVTTEKWIEKAINVHGKIYDYSGVNYTHSEEKVSIYCPNEDAQGIAHGWFDVLACEHLKGTRCRKCTNQEKFYTTNKFKELSTNTHGDKYSYPNSVYTHSEEKLTIDCPIHGPFEQTAYKHIMGSGCPMCKDSKPENDIDIFIKELGFETIRNNRLIISPYEIDIYIPELKIGIEYCGIFWHSDKHRPDNYHLIKYNKAIESGIQLIQIFEDEWINTPDIVKSRLRNILGKTPNIIYARKTKFIKLTPDITKQFLIDNHIQGNTNSSINYGLAVLNEQSGKYQLVSVMTFGKPRINLGNKQSGENDYELVRFCNKLDTSVIGGASKLLKYFISKHKPENIISYADKRWSLGNLYEKLGFILSHESKPNYFYVNSNQRINRFKYRKDILVSNYGCSNTDTERNFTKNVLGLNRIYDCGTKVYKLSLTNNKNNT